MTMFTDDLVRARDWYVDRLDYKVDFDSDWFVQLRSPTNDAVELGILKRDHELVPEGFRGPRAGAMLTVVVDDVEAVYRKAQDRGDQIIEVPRNLFYGQRRLLLQDPDGMLVDVSSECEPDPEWLASLGAG